jgi:polysaccharide export outer membrane protein
MSVLKGAGLLVLLCISMAGCASPGPVGLAPSIQEADLSALPAPGVSDRLAATDPLEIAPLDTITVTVFGVSDLSQTIQVGADGNFRYPLIGTVSAAGRAPAQIEREIEDRLRGRYVREPYVNLAIGERKSQFITVGGEVAAPGQYALNGQTTLLEAVTLGGGTSEFAKLSDVLIFRTIDSQRYIGVYDLEAIQRGNYADPRIYPDDIIMVGDSPNRRLIRDIIQVAPLVTTPLILLERTLD